MLKFFPPKLKPIINHISEENLNELQYNECIKCIEFFQNSEYKAETLSTSSFIVPSVDLSSIKKKDLYKIIWNELEEFLKVNQDKSERHKLLYNHVKKIRQSSVKNEIDLNKNGENSYKLDKLDKVIAKETILEL